jgi:hypothetical protein
MSDERGAGSGVRLRLARRARGFSQQQLAAMAGVSRHAGCRKVGEFLELPAKPCDSKPPMMGMPGFLTLPKCAYAPSGAPS